MIDLHIHTSYSDGNNTVEQILEKAETLGLTTIAFTDHDSCGAYYELKNTDVRRLFKGTIKNGIEITTAYDGVRIELLAFDFDDYKLVNDYFVSATNNIDWEPVMIEERKILLDKFKALGIKYDSIYDYNLLLHRYESNLYKSILESNDKEFLQSVLKEYYSESGSNFYRNSISNPNSPFYANYGKYRPNIEDIIDFIHSQNGIVLLAHPYGYRLSNTEEYIEQLYNEHKLDGIECYYYSFNKEQIKYLEDFAKQRNLLISGGSDFHGTENKPEELGKCNFGYEFISSSIIENWPTKDNNG